MSRAAARVTEADLKRLAKAVAAAGGRVIGEIAKDGTSMPKLRYRHLHQETHRGVCYWYFRRGHGKRIRLRGAYGLADFRADYHAAFAGEPLPSGETKIDLPAIPRLKREKPFKRKVSAEIDAAIRASVPENILAADSDCGTYVYFMKAGNTVKIGHSKNPRERAKSLQTSRHEQIEILYTVSGGRITERYFHNKFAKCRLHGEWFQYGSRIALFLAGLPYEESAIGAEPIL